ncbi:hypothetical protein OHB41_51630 [Streptomyces sp. NBC_01571]|uniref:hypothetical protein n=1 Tax=Streptomyces sp. NBC_01571 TaxID=2975883 RepID=UPI00225610E6|nr:hypothetical protein [Streptomyces sp. NBC_01571]MCX4581412.1 hypothetical protein [Streptomyces sp. NBC_01571]
MLLRVPGAEVVHVHIGKWLNNLQDQGKGLTEDEANKLRTLGWTLEKAGEVNRGGRKVPRYKLKPTPDQRQNIRRPFEQYLLALDTWRADHSTAIPGPGASVSVRGVDGREQSVTIGNWLDNLRARGLKNWDSLLAGALRARGIPTMEKDGSLWRTGTSGSVVPVWGVEVYLRGLAAWRAAAPAGEDRSTAIPPDGTYITLTDPTPTPLTDASNTRRREHNATDSAATTSGADIPIGTWLFQARHQGLTGLTDHEITQLQAAGLHIGETDTKTRRTRLYWDHPGTTTPTHTTSPRHTGTSHQPDTHQHPTHPTTTTTPAPPSRKRPRPADDAQTGEQPPGSNHGRRPKRGKGRPAAAPRGGRPRQTAPQGDPTTTTTAAAAVAGQDRPAPPAPHAQPAPGLPATQPDTGTSTRPAPPMNTDTPAPPTDPSTSHHPGPPITDSGWPADGMGDAPAGPGVERPGSAVPAGMFDPRALDDLFLPGEPPTAAAEGRGQQAEKSSHASPKHRKTRIKWTDELTLAAMDAWRNTEYPDKENCTEIPPVDAKVSVRIPNTDRYENVRIGDKIHNLITKGVKRASPYLIAGLENRHLHMEKVDDLYRIVRQAGQTRRHEWSIKQFIAGLLHWRSEDRSNTLPQRRQTAVFAVPGSDTPSTVPIGSILYNMLYGERKLTGADIALLRQHGIHLSEPDNGGRRRVLQNPAPTASGSGTGPDPEAQPRHTRQDGTDAGGPPPQPHSLPQRRRRALTTTSAGRPVRKRPRPTPAGTPRHSVPQGAPTPQPAQQPAAETSRPGITTPEQEQQQDPARDAATWPGDHADEAAGQDPEGLGDKPAAHAATGATHESEESTTRTAGPPPADGPPPHTATRAAPAAGMPADAGTAEHQAMSVEDYILDQMRGRPRTAE